MAELRLLSKIEQIAEFLRGELEQGRWQGLMPGRLELAAELGLNARTVEEALRLLEREGVLVPQGAGRKRKIRDGHAVDSKRLRIGFLMYEQADSVLPYHVDLVHRLEDEGHQVVTAEQTMVQLGMEVKKIARMVERMRVDAWVVQGGSREILAWLSRRPEPVMAQFGLFHGLSVAAAGVKKIPAIRKAVRRLHAMGHRRISLLVREEQRKPFLGVCAQAFLDELESLGIRTGRYNLPEWKNQPADFHHCIDMLFRHTPPTALLISEARLFLGAQQHLARIGFVAPRDVSLICDDPDVLFDWCDPQVSHIRWDTRPLVNRIVRWADRQARGVSDMRQRFTLAELIEGGTIGPVPRRR